MTGPGLALPGRRGCLTSQWGSITGHIVACLQEGEFRKNRKHCGLATRTEERP